LTQTSTRSAAPASGGRSTAGAERVEVGAARDERDVVSAAREERAEVPADRAGPVDEDVHRAILPGVRGA
jgi:hypothetical protein